MSIELRSTVDGDELYFGGLLVMSEKPEEINEMARSASRAYGNCFVGGLGLGIVVKMMAQRPEVSSIDVVEMVVDVVDTISPGINQLTNKVRYFIGDALTLFPNPPYDFIYYDIWPNTSQEVIDEAYRACRKYLRYGGIFEAWELPRWNIPTI